ncbi:hypothetical protein DICSQDRAFT_137248 [Dichomitus squalens LYAD-421 SS1]|uniref:Uncharacterized protein n=1 Tax=Dichomitus squalens (strain LYAD-421) TaxID=732165 RepID=R7SYC8_DICSQ|nr:uncharacterized protein DICSQDRAFT_137248 [Dichomitus squalens LYAD-421 SS1]EJF60715.1 hypothetical protein DICSQDRAFT_137248 [Dichomitus squalens LYAD-421 SS1]
MRLGLAGQSMGSRRRRKEGVTYTCVTPQVIPACMMSLPSYLLQSAQVVPFRHVSP